MPNPMRNESARLNSFRNWPSRVGVSPLALAGAGFYYLGQEDKVMCFSCRGTVMCWDEGDDPRAEHKKHFPQCRFLQNPRSAGNIFYYDDNDHSSTASDSAEAFDSASCGSTQSDSAQPRSSQGHSNGYTETDKAQPAVSQKHVNTENMKDERARLETLRSWPKKNIIEIAKVAKAGLYFTGTEDKLQCAYCNGSMVNWTRGDDPAEEHKKHFGQRCPFIKGNAQTSNNTQQQKGNTSSDLHSQLHRLNIVADRPKNQDMANFDRRFSTFETWPIERVQNSQSMAEAGFFYIGTGDQVRCFFCNVGLSNWDAVDDPWKEHGKWSPKCGYLGLCPEPTDDNQTVVSEHFDQVPSSPTSLEEENRRLKAERLCKACKTRDSRVVFLPCGHIVTCDQCAPTVKKCLNETCKKTVEGTVKAFMA